MRPNIHKMGLHLGEAGPNRGAPCPCGRNRGTGPDTDWLVIATLSDMWLPRFFNRPWSSLPVYCDPVLAATAFAMLCSSAFAQIISDCDANGAFSGRRADHFFQRLRSTTSALQAARSTIPSRFRRGSGLNFGSADATGRTVTACLSVRTRPAATPRGHLRPPRGIHQRRQRKRQ
jgi:hypothetical protein